ncbi:RAMP superfamily CRISPR-associated protein [Thermanaeromonas sp. C210]|uniref:RAMP superfamily CRISPR-associated protein n=1 Tax=Thermanaeromonas sp. C210 TaxID=2731925 RepID=UPI001C251D12|nr:RAMP superfamily CRISPR-associated protein [Thermanaeromonas sp. C210]
MARGTLLRDKPYTFVPLLPVRPEDRREIVPHNRLDGRRWTGKLVLELEVVTPLHIGSGSLRLIGGQPVQTFLRRGETPVIPGSSLKGAVRSLAEAVARSCLAQSPARSVARLDNAFPPGVRTQCTEEAACITCRLFGFTGNDKGYRGRVMFGEFRPAGEVELTVARLPALEQPFKDYPREENKGGGNERLYYCRFYLEVPCNGPLHCPDCTKEEWLNWKKRLKGRLPPPSFRGRKFYLQGVPRTGNQPCEMVMPGSCFQGEITFQNLDRDELALLCFALGLDGAMRLSLGYGKPAYYGTVRLKLREVSWYARHSFFVKPDYPDPVELAQNYGSNDPDIQKNVALVRQILSGIRRGPEWGAKGY